MQTEHSVCVEPGAGRPCLSEVPECADLSGKRGEIAPACNTSSWWAALNPTWRAHEQHLGVIGSCCLDNLCDIPTSSRTCLVYLALLDCAWASSGLGVVVYTKSLGSRVLQALRRMCTVPGMRLCQRAVYTADPWCSAVCSAGTAALGVGSVHGTHT